jgi:predicted lipid-binding transport protein (Tim44 family)
MAKSQSKSSDPPRPGAKIQPSPRSRWQGPLAAGLCFGLGYGITQRLLSLQLPTFVQLGQGFELRAFPGTALQSLRLKFGSEAQPIRGDLEREQLDPVSKAPDPSGELAKDGLGEAETPSQNGPQSANLDAVSGLAPPEPLLPPPASPRPAPVPAPQP